jgi:hypothetical protein
MQILNNQRVHASTTNPELLEINLIKPENDKDITGTEYRFTIDAF